MGLLFEFYAFDGPAPSHEQVWQMLCEIIGHEVRREVYIAPAELVGSDGRTAGGVGQGVASRIGLSVAQRMEAADHLPRLHHVR